MLEISSHHPLVNSIRSDDVSYISPEYESSSFIIEICLWNISVKNYEH